MAGNSSTETTPDVLEMDVVECKKHNHCVMEHLQSFYQEKAMCDVTLIAEKFSIQAHRVVLAANSDYFRAMFFGNWSEKRKSKITLHQLTPCGLKAVVEFSYSGKFTVNSENFGDILAALHHCQLVEAYEKCEIYLCKNKITKENFLDLLRLSDLYSLKKLNQSLVQFAAKNLMPKFNNFECTVYANQINVVSYEFFKDVFKVFRFSANASKSVKFGVFAFYDIIVKWIKFDIDGRKQYLHELVSIVNNLAWDCPEILRYCLLTSTERSQDIGPLHDTEPLYFVTVVKDNPSRTSHKMQLVIFSSNDILPKVIYSFPLCYLNTEEYELCVADSTLYVISAHRSYRYDVCFDKWTSVQPLPGPLTRSDFSVVVLNGKVMVLGGLDRYKDTLLDTVDIYDPSTNTWSQGVPLPKKVYKHAAVSHAGQVYVTGGRTVFEGKSSSMFLCFDPDKASWIEKEHALAPVCNHVLAAHRNSLYMCEPNHRGNVIFQYYNLSDKPGHWTKIEAVSSFLDRWHTATCGILSFQEDLFLVIDNGQDDCDEGLTLYQYEKDAPELKDKQTFGTNSIGYLEYKKNALALKMPEPVYRSMPELDEFPSMVSSASSSPGSVSSNALESPESEDHSSGSGDDSSESASDV